MVLSDTAPALGARAIGGLIARGLGADKGAEFDPYQERGRNLINSRSNTAG